jgi:hypothetical protein
MSENEIRIRDFPEVSDSNSLGNTDFFNLIKGGSFIDNRISLNTLFSYINNRLYNETVGYKTLNKNLLINGDAKIVQRGSSFNLTNTSSPVYTLDRFFYRNDSPSPGAVTISRVNETSGKSASGYALKTLVTTVSTTSSLANIGQAIEGFNISGLKWGTPSAKPVTLSFPFKTSTPGTYAVCLQGGTPLVSYNTTFTITAADVYQDVVINIPGPTVSTWEKNNGVGLVLRFDLGSNNNVSSSDNVWQTGDFQTSIGVSKILGVLNGYIEICNIQLEVGNQATEFEYRTYQAELALCQRYYEKSYNPEVNPGTSTTVGLVSIGTQNVFSGSNYTTPGSSVNFRVTKRSTPSITFYDAVGNSSKISNYFNGGRTDNNSGYSVLYSGNNNFSIYGSNAVGPAIHYAVDSEL